MVNLLKLIFGNSVPVHHFIVRLFISLSLSIVGFTAPLSGNAATAASRLALLPQHFSIGVLNQPGQHNLMQNAPWEYRYQYVSPGWDTSWGPSDGSFVKNYASQGQIPVFCWYMVGMTGQGAPHSGLFSSFLV